jgi:hypothetical protein
MREDNTADHVMPQLRRRPTLPRLLWATALSASLSPGCYEYERRAVSEVREESLTVVRVSTTDGLLIKLRWAEVDDEDGVRGTVVECDGDERPLLGYEPLPTAWCPVEGSTVAIPASRIAELQVREVDGDATAGAVVGTIFGVAAVAGIVAGVAIGSAFSGMSSGPDYRH